MNKTELIDAIADATGVTKADVKRVIDGLADIVGKTLKKGIKISLPGFLSFEKVRREARTGRNPSTGKEIKITAKNVVRVKVGKTLSDMVN